MPVNAGDALIKVLNTDISGSPKQTSFHEGSKAVGKKKKKRSKQMFLLWLFQRVTILIALVFLIFSQKKKKQPTPNASNF